MTNRTLIDMVRHVNHQSGSDVFSSNTNSLTTKEDIVRYLNEAQRIAARAVLQVKEDYFLSYEDFPVIPNKTEYDLPEFIYVNKIRKVAYYFSNRYFVIPQEDINRLIYGLDPAEVNSSPSFYCLLEQKQTSSDRASVRKTKLVLGPGAGFTTINSLRIYYLRVPTPLVNDTDIADLPDSEDFIVAYAVYKIAQVDPSATTELLYKDMMDRKMELQNSFVDRTPKEGGNQLKIPQEIINTHTNFVDNL